VHHHRRVDPVERAPVQQEELAAAALLGRGPHHGHREPEVVGERGQPHPGARRRGGDDVVAAGVPDAGQRVVLRAHRDVQRPRADRRLEGGGELGHAAFDREPGGVHRLGQPGAGLLLLEAELRVGVDAMTERDQLAGVLLDPASRRRLGSFDVDAHQPPACPRSIMPAPLWVSSECSRSLRWPS
jgi:hypothetical protein